MKTCTTCGETKPLGEFHRDKRKADGRRYQCKACTNARQYEFQLKHKAETGQWYSRQYTYERTCIQCGVTWSASSTKVKYCSNACQAEAEHGPDRIPRKGRAAYLKRQRLLKRIAKAAEGTRGTIPFVAGPCAACGTLLVTHRGDIRWCSYKCKRKMQATRRRARERAAFIEDVSPQRIYKRDGWRCQLCGTKVRRDKTAPHPQAPTLDHIIPLAKGGKHEAVNVQCAHFICNSIKSDRGGGQLLLIG